jgi:hypothetical protein
VIGAGTEAVEVELAHVDEVTAAVEVGGTVDDGVADVVPPDAPEHPARATTRRAARTTRIRPVLTTS